MQITCRRQDMQEFEKLGFRYENWNNEPDAPLVVMLDEEANNAHTGNMPDNIPYQGFNGVGGNYGDGAFACDGKTYAEVETGHNGGFVVDWENTKQRPSLLSLNSICRYIKIRNKVEKLFVKLGKSRLLKKVNG